MSNKKAFTIIELSVVVIIMGILVTFGFPSLFKAINRTKARDAMNNLRSIHTLNTDYFARNGVNFTGATIAAINAGLGLNIMPNGATYACAANVCTATTTAFTITLNLGASNPLNLANPSCASGQNACP